MWLGFWVVPNNHLKKAIKYLFFQLIRDGQSRLQSVALCVASESWNKCKATFYSDHPLHEVASWSQQHPYYCICKSVSIINTEII